MFILVSIKEGLQSIKVPLSNPFFVIKGFFYFFNIILFFSKYDFMIFAV